MKVEVDISFDASAQAFLTKLRQDFQRTADAAHKEIDARLKALEARDRQLEREIGACKRQLKVLTDPPNRQRAIRAAKGI